MKRFSYSAFSALAALFFSASPIFATSIPILTVYVMDPSGNPIPSAQVAALHFGSSGPTQDTRIANANGAGVALFGSLVDNDWYHLSQ